MICRSWSTNDYHYLDHRRQPQYTLPTLNLGKLSSPSQRLLCLRHAEVQCLNLAFKQVDLDSQACQLVPNLPHATNGTAMSGQPSLPHIFLSLIAACRMLRQPIDNERTNERTTSGRTTTRSISRTSRSSRFNCFAISKIPICIVCTNARSSQFADTGSCLCDIVASRSQPSRYVKLHQLK